jgi:hypothetical protein
MNLAHFACIHAGFRTVPQSTFDSSFAFVNRQTPAFHRF